MTMLARLAMGAHSPQKRHGVADAALQVAAELEAEGAEAGGGDVVGELVHDARVDELDTQVGHETADHFDDVRYRAVVRHHVVDAAVEAVAVEHEAQRAHRVAEL